jgi:ribonuclease E
MVTEPTTGAAGPTSQDLAGPSTTDGPPPSAASASPVAAGETDEPTAPAAERGRPRRRGRRGGRNRRRSAPAAAAGAPQAPGPGPTGDGRRRNERAALDRGLTDEDVAETAAEDAGLRRPRVGDTRPAPPLPGVREIPPPPSGPPAPAGGPSPAAPGGTRRRRRRGGRGRRRPGPDGGAEVVTADLGLEDAPELDEELLERRRGPQRKGRPTGRYLMVVHVGGDGTVQMGVLEGRMLVEHYVSRPADDAGSIDGNIYLGRVENVLPGMEAAFVDIGTPKSAVLYQRDVIFDEVEERTPKIEQALRPGQAVVVQVTKNPIGAKGARLTQEVSLAGRFVVMVPGQPQTYGISKRLPDPERRRLRGVLEALRPADAGLIVRTAAEGATPVELERDVRRLQAQWEQIADLAARSKPPRLLYQEPPLVVRLIREEFTREYRGVVVDDPALFEEVRSYVEAIAPELADRVEYYDDPHLPVFERYHVHEQVHKALDRKVWLPSGGSLVIERTEALTVIDVNTGRNVGRTNLEETVFQNNLEAADEIARQLRLRDIGGIIVIDFIDMELPGNRARVVQRLREALARDKTRTQVFDISELGLVEMTRKRISEGLVEAFSRTCPSCEGRGFLVDTTML